MQRIKPGSAGREARKLPLCYADPKKRATLTFLMNVLKCDKRESNFRVMMKGAHPIPRTDFLPLALLFQPKPPFVGPRKSFGRVEEPEQKRKDMSE